MQRSRICRRIGCRLVLITALVGLTCSTARCVGADTAGAGSADTWPVFRGDSRSTGAAQGDLPATLDLLWEYRVPDGAFESTPVIAAGVVYIADLDGCL